MPASEDFSRRAFLQRLSTIVAAAAAAKLAAAQSAVPNAETPKPPEPAKTPEPATDPLGHHFTYGSAVEPSHITTFTYDRSGLLVKVTSPPTPKTRNRKPD